MPVCHTGGREFESRQPRWQLIERSRSGAARERVRLRRSSEGAVAQLGERLNGIQEVRGSIPLGSIVMHDSARVAELVDAQGSGPCGG